MSKDPAPAKPKRAITPQAGRADVEAFVRQARALARPSGGGSGRLILALDATMSRQPTWDLACQLQADMFDAAGSARSLAMQLVYFRGLGECRSSKFVTEAAALKRLMTAIQCRGGHTQIGKVLSHALSETAKAKVAALVYIGDALEEPIDDLAEKAGRMGLLGVPAFLFHEGTDAAALAGFREIARLSKGACFSFDRHAAAHLARLLGAVAVFAAGGLAALEARGRQEDRLLIEHLRGGRR